MSLRLRGETFYLLDVNPNANFTPDASLPYAVEATGLTYGYFARTLVKLAAQHHPFPGLVT